MKLRPDYFERIRSSAVKRWEQLEADAELAGPWHQLFKQVQSPRHVLSELLQNADDAGATRASVMIENGVFVFSHNGEDFIEEHFASLCRFGYSNKRALHTIGFRGIGFKSTFSLGDTVELYTPTLAVAFHKHRFTAPEWLADEIDTDGETRVSVRIATDHRRREIEKNLEEWIASPISLLFFKHIRQLTIGNTEAHWQWLGDGPLSDSEWMGLNGAEGERFLIVRSALEDFPSDALAEIRQERLLGADQEMAFPPCKVELVLGAPGRLYVVLPTGVETALPFACNAPFIQDPARMRIKDPETSPTNQWLLERTGRLAASAMLAWLGNDALAIEERARAYDLLSNVDRSDNSLEGVCSTIAEEALGEALSESDVVLTHAGSLVADSEAVHVPVVLLDIWPAQKVIEYFDPQSRAPLCPHVSESNRAKLSDWGMLEAISTEDVVAVLELENLPQPSSWAQLLKLWAYLAPGFRRFRPTQRDRSLAILPVQGKATLHAANEVVRLGEKRLLQSDSDWGFLSSYLLVLNQNWTRFLAEQRRLGAEGNADAEVIESAFAMLEQLGLLETSDANAVISRVSERFFESDNIEAARCVQLAQIAAKLGAAVGENFRYVTCDSRVRQASETIIVDEDGRIEALFAPEWVDAHILSHDYFTAYRSCTREEWLQWAKSTRSRLASFASPEEQEKPMSGQANARKEIQRRGYAVAGWFPYVTSIFQVHDWDFAEEHWRHWNALTEGDPATWGRVLERLLMLPETWAAKCGSAKIIQQATSKKWSSVTAHRLLPGWILRFREQPCLRDTRGNYRKPGDLLRRTPETEPFMDVEPFVDARLDTEASRWLLKLLGVRDVPTGPERLLEILRALSRAPNPPGHEVDKWYGRLDQMIDHGSTKDLELVRNAIQQEKVILAASGEWTNSAGVFLSADDEDVPGVLIVRPSVRDLMLWRKVGVAERPTVELAIAWLRGLPSGKALAQEEVRRVRLLLARHPETIWYQCKHWLNLAGEWVAVDGLKYGYSMQSMVAWAHLHKWVKQATANFQDLPAEMVGRPPFAGLLALSTQIEERFERNPHFARPAKREAWLNQLGIELCRYVGENSERTEGVRVLAKELRETRWQVAQDLRTIPYIDGKPAGTARPVEVLWRERVLYAEQRPLPQLAPAVVHEIGRAFQRPEIGDAVKFCFDREPAYVTAYMEATFKLAPRDEVEPSPEKEPADPHQHPVGGGPGGDQPGGASGPEPDPGKGPGAPEPDPEPKPAPDPAPPDPTPPDPPKPPKPPRLAIIERFAVAQGFRKVGDDRYQHGDGSIIVRRHGGGFPWELLGPQGQSLCLLPREHCLEKEPLQLDAVAWGLLELSPAGYALVLEGVDGAPRAVSGAQLRTMLDDQRLALYPATYRLAYETENQ